MPDHNVGDGIRGAMAAQGDTPLQDSDFLVTEIGYGHKARYIAQRLADGTWTPAHVEAWRAPEGGPILNLDIRWIGSTNFTAGRKGLPVRAIVLHTMEGFLAGSDSWFNNPASEVSAHFGVGLAGAAHQYVELKDTAWGNGRPTANNRWPFGTAVTLNEQTVSIETEDNKNPALPVPNVQYATVRDLCVLIMAEFPSITHLVAHRAIDTGRSCPGPRWVESGRLEILAAELGLTLVV